MVDDIERLKKKIKEVFDENSEIDEESDMPVHEKRVKERKLRYGKK